MTEKNDRFFFLIYSTNSKSILLVFKDDAKNHRAESPPRRQSESANETSIDEPLRKKRGRKKEKKTE